MITVAFIPKQEKVRVDTTLGWVLKDGGTCVKRKIPVMLIDKNGDGYFICYNGHNCPFRGSFNCKESSIIAIRKLCDFLISLEYTDFM